MAIERWVGSGCAPVTADPRGAGASAASAALAGRADPQLVLVFASSRCDLGAVLAGIRSAIPAAPLLGCSTAGEIGPGGAADETVVVMALGGPGFSAAVHAADARALGPREAGAEATRQALAQAGPGENQIVVLLSDPLAGDQQEVVRGAYATVGAACPLVGGCAGDDLAMTTTYQLVGPGGPRGADTVRTGHVVAAAVWSTGAFGIGVRHGWGRVGEPMLITAAEGTVVRTLDGRPALDAYLDRLDAPAAVRSDAGEFTRFALTHPLGLSRRSGEDVRMVAGADFTERSLTCIAAVPEGGLCWIMAGDADSVLSATETACAQAVAALGGAPAAGLVAFDCIARRSVLGEDGLPAEVDRLVAAAAGAPVAGFYTYGEIARSAPSGGFHNQTLVVLAVS